MAGDLAILWRNYDSSDQTKNNSYRIGQHIPTLDTLGWSSPTGKSFKEWNTSKDGTGTAYQPGDQIPTSLYAIWSDESYKKLINLSLLNRFLGNLNTLLESIQAAIEAKIPAKYAASESAGGPATVTNGIHYAQVDGSSTATVFTASIDGITEYYDGLTVLLKNGVITSASGFTVNINGLGAKPVYSNMSAATRETTIFNVNYTLMLIYDSTRVTGGCWINYRGYYSDANSTGYQLRTDSTILKTLDPSRYYRLMFTSADGTHWVPANTAKDNSATSQKTVNQRPIDPFGRIIYFGYTTNLSAESDVPNNYCWDQHTVALGYSFNTSGAALELTTKTPVYIKCAPQSNGSAIIDSTTPYVQALPSTDDGMIYIYLGVAYSATNIELVSCHPVYYYKDGAIRLWTGVKTLSGDISIANGTHEDGTAIVMGEIGLNSASGKYSIAAGKNNTVSGLGSVAFGMNSNISGKCAAALGLGATVTGDCSFASGWNVHALAQAAHAEGQGVQASGGASHAEGYYTIANHLAQHVIGTYNIADPSEKAASQTGTYIEIVGNGNSDSERSNARTLDWHGNEVLSGKLTVGAGPTENMDVATKQYVDQQTSGATAMTDQEIENAFATGWEYKILVESDSYILSVSCDGSHGIGVGVITESVGNSTITVEMSNSNSGLKATKLDDHTEISRMSLGNGVFSFTMPFSDILLTLATNSGGSND